MKSPVIHFTGRSWTIEITLNDMNENDLYQATILHSEARIVGIILGTIYMYFTTLFC